MTHSVPPTLVRIRRRRIRRLLRLRPWLVVLALALLVLPAPFAAADPEPENWVARVRTKDGDRYLSRSRLAAAVYWRIRSQLKQPGAGPLTILRQFIEERVVLQEARRLGIQVTRADVEAKYRELDAQVRQMSNGAKTLQDVIRREGKTTPTDFMDGLHYMLVKERVASHQRWIGKLPANENAKLAQIGVVVAELMKNAKVEYGVPCALQAEPTPMGPNEVVKVNGEPITVNDYGEELIKRLATKEIQAIIEEECKSVLTMERALTPEQMDAVIKKEREEWEKVRGLATQEVLHTLPYEEWVRLQYKLEVANLRNDRFYRGLFGLMQHFRGTVTDEAVRKDWEENRDTVWGDRYLVTDFVIAFSPRNQALLGSQGGRTYKEALKAANELLRRIHGGEDFDKLMNEVAEQKNASYLVKRIGVRNTGNEVHLYEQAKLLQDEQVSRPFETLTEVHVLRREKRIRPPTFDEVSDSIRARLAKREAHDWLEERMTDAEVVEILWPPK